MPINTPKPQTPEAIIRHRLRLHGFTNEHATMVAHALVFAVDNPAFVAQFGTFGQELLAEAIGAFDQERL